MKNSMTNTIYRDILEIHMTSMLKGHIQQKGTYWTLEWIPGWWRMGLGNGDDGNKWKIK